MKKLLTGALVLGGLLISSTPLFAAQTYQYIDTNGNLQAVIANNPTEAIQIAPNIALHSGVMLVAVGGGDLNIDTNAGTGTDGLHTYGYIDMQGLLQTVTAQSPEEAIRLASNIDPHSGVVLISN